MVAKQIFDHLKSRVTYKADPPNVELLQSMPSLFNDNYWGKSGWGDCDCFTITACAVLLENNFKTGFTLYGNERQPSHIAADVYLPDGPMMRAIPFDLTAPSIDRVNQYLWSQHHVIHLQ